MLGPALKTLVLTVGGSHKPLLGSIRHHNADHVVFLCTEGPKGSLKQVRGEGLVCQKDYGSPPNLPNIPTQAGLSESAWSTRSVDPDDPQSTYRVASEVLAEAIAADGAAVVDYTGGTKSMSAGLYLAAAMNPEARVSLMAGARVDLVAVVDGTEAALPVDADAPRDAFALRLAAEAWRRHDYRMADEVLTLRATRSEELMRARTLSRAFQAWDDVDYVRAFGLLEAHPQGWGSLLATVRRLGQEDSEPQRIADLYRSAERRAAAGRYDLAVLQLYRVLEWVAQWVLRSHHDIDTSAVRADLVADVEELVVTTHDGKRVLGMERAWRALGALGGAWGEVARASEGHRRDLAARRNPSLLAHGTRPLTREDWQQASHVLGSVWRAFVQEELGGREPPQLPTSWEPSA